MIRRLPLAIALFVCALLAVAGSASARIHYLHPEAVRVHKASGPRPSISRVSPMQVKVGRQLVIYGKNFRKGAGKNKVLFLNPHGGVVVAKASVGTPTKLVVSVPGAVTDLLNLKGKTPVATKLQVRVLTNRFGSATKLSKSPTVLPASGKTGGTGSGGPACRQATTADSDGDGLTNALEIKTLGTDPCKADTDGDGVPDGYEYQSALDLNNTTLTGRDSQNSLPCACAKPYPNPLDPTDATVDHDGDGLTMQLEYQLNKYAHGPKVGSLQYSDGKQRSQDVQAPNATGADPVHDYRDLVRYPSLNNGWLSDDERDADNDGLSNWDECCGRMTPDWWDAKYNGSNGFPKESHYVTVDSTGGKVAANFPGVDPMNPDTNGNGVPDGMDDQDHDGLSNEFEVSRPWDWWVTYVSTAHSGPKPENYASAGSGGVLPDGVGPNPWARVQPFNPCKPVYSKTCSIIIPGNAYDSNEDWAGADPETIGPQPAAPWLYDTVHDNVYPFTGPSGGESYQIPLG